MANKDNFYTITEQYHEKKGTYIYVLRLIKNVSKDEFSNLRECAKDYDGYYSTYRGVNGFVFHTEEDAESFASILDSYFDISDIDKPIEDSNEKRMVAQDEEPKKTKQKRQRIQTTQDSDYIVAEPIKINPGMSFHEALRNIIQTQGRDIVTELRLINILDDFHAYDSIPASKYILRAIIADGYAKKILALGRWDNSSQALSTKFASTIGFIPEHVIRIFKSIAFGVGWLQKWDEESILTNPISPNLSSNNTTLSTAKPSYSKWSSKMDEDQTEQFFLSIVEYDKSDEAKYKVRLENLQFYVDEDEDLHISCDLRRKHKKATPSLYYTRYTI